MSRKLVNVFENREMRFGFLVLCFALMGHRSKRHVSNVNKRAKMFAVCAWIQIAVLVSNFLHI